MKDYWGRPLTTLALVALAALILWPIAGRVGALIFFATALLLLNLHHLRNLSSLSRWARHGGAGATPEGSGMWDSVFAHLGRMQRVQRDAEMRLSAAVERFQQATIALPEGLVIIDEQDRIRWFNPKAELHFGLDLSRDRGQPITHLVRQPQFAAYVQAENYREPLHLKPALERDFSLSVQLVPYGDQQKLVISRDITRWEKLETMRRDFVANVSHELRTPLTVIGGFLETLSSPSFDDRAMLLRAHELMREQTTRMERLIEDLLALSRLESASNPLSEAVVDVPALARALHDEAKSVSRGRHEVRLDLKSDVHILGSEDELRSAFSNLISNAIRYTPDGGKIMLAWEEVSRQPRFVVKDTGIGMEAEHIPRLTERFYRVDKSRSRETGGTGLGLAIVKHVLNRHQAMLEIESKPGVGSAFCAVFPEGRARQRETELREARAETGDR
ncbi:MAG: phosphate regulon sensor histidine kinase PhoR [Burkholderiales bacterium]